MEVIVLDSSDSPAPVRRSPRLFVSSSSPSARRLVAKRQPKLVRSSAHASSSLPSIIEISSSPSTRKSRRLSKIALPSSPTMESAPCVADVPELDITDQHNLSVQEIKSMSAPPSDDIQLGSIFDIGTNTTLVSPLKPLHKESTPTTAPRSAYSPEELDAMLEHARIAAPKELKQINKMQRTKEELMAEVKIEFETKLHAKLLEINADLDSLLEPVQVATASLFLPLIQFKRTIQSVYHDEKGAFVPVEKYDTTESTVVLFYEAADLVEKIKDDSLRTIITRVKRTRDNANIVVMINGYDQHLQTLRTQHNRAFVTQVMQKMGKDKPQRKLERENSTISAETVRQKLAELEIFFGIHLFPIKGLRELVEWLKSFCYTMASKHYDPHERHPDLANVGNIRSGQTPEECYQESLKQFKYLVTSTARTLVKEYPTLAELAHTLQTKVPSLVRTDVEQNLKKAFTSTDPNELLND
ncbi:hypothetical protein OGAPHI_007186 [Ogataea philodendri]|uniref:ERCC4 domain-containing protein n=1 Tax=Ogataea philodendri TaxID=1378263 RepID=A0A9P8NVG4_9ASCO|nr:uncharacterized protein OGAPHI_007186 [Ogataea philodendri]KAH3659981.1 hypothetical protein OGAPHI_007186 [Ogataea philodendri]